MSYHVWKYSVPVIGVPFDVVMPEDAKILCVQMQRRLPTMWALVNASAPQTVRTFVVYGTGRLIHDAPQLRYVGTVQELDGDFVWHVFEFEKLP